MIGIRKYHDPDYDGIVLKIPSWFIPMNELEEPLRQLLEALENSKKSMFHPDHTKNISELENYKDKQSHIQEEKNKAKEEKDLRQKRFDELIKGERYELVWEFRSEMLNNPEHVRINGESYDESEVLNKSSVNSKIQKIFKDSINSLEDLIVFAKENHAIHLQLDLEYGDIELFDMSSFQLYYSKSGWGGIGLSYKVLRIKYNWKEDGIRYKYFTGRLGKSGDEYSLIIGNKEPQVLKGFVRYGIELIKK